MRPLPLCSWGFCCSWMYRSVGWYLVIDVLDTSRSHLQELALKHASYRLSWKVGNQVSTLEGGICKLSRNIGHKMSTLVNGINRLSWNVVYHLSALDDGTDSLFRYIGSRVSAYRFDRSVTKWQALSMGPMVCAETSVTCFQPTPRKSQKSDGTHDKPVRMACDPAEMRTCHLRYSSLTAVFGFPLCYAIPHRFAPVLD
jgi:hypothetical protein